MMQLLMIWFLGLHFTLDEESVAMVYFANMNVWEEIQPGPTICPLKSTCDVCIKGVLYLLTCRILDTNIFVLDELTS